MSDAMIACIAAWTVVAIVAYAYRRQSEEMRRERRLRIHWEAIAMENKKRRQADDEAAARQRPSVFVAGEPVQYMLLSGHVTRPFFVGKSPFSLN